MKSLRRELSLYIFECTRRSTLNISGDDNMEEIPVPIPNTEVKLQCAEDICRLPCWENRLSPGFFIFINNLIYIRKVKKYILDINHYSKELITYKKNL